MFTMLFWLVLILAVADWLSTARGWQHVRWVTKPGTLLILIAWFSQAGGWQNPLFWFGLGLSLSLAGDTLLMGPKHFFLPGLVAFLLAHVAYIIGFSHQPIALRWEAAVPVVFIAAVFGLLNGKIRAGLRQKGENSLQAPVMLYAGIISLMWLMAFSTLFRPGWHVPAILLVIAGAGLFFVSDLSLAFSRFVRPIRNGDLLVMVTYHLAQVCITLGVLVQYTKQAI